MDKTHFYHGSASPNLKILAPGITEFEGTPAVLVSKHFEKAALFSLIPIGHDSFINWKTKDGLFVSGVCKPSQEPLKSGYVYIVSSEDVENPKGYEFVSYKEKRVLAKIKVSKDAVEAMGWTFIQD